MLDVSSHYTNTGPEAGFNITPLVDVVFLLLIFFLLASVFVQPALEVELPEAAHSQQERPAEKQLSIVVTREGDVFVNKMPIPLAELQAHLQAVLAHNRDIPVMVQADRESAFASFVAVMDAAKGAGVAQLIIETRPPRTTEGG
jgi:biopolymer transport protein ExbD